MPDGSYRTELAPVLFALPPRASRDPALSVMGVLGRTWPGRVAIDLLGHMRPLLPGYAAAIGVHYVVGYRSTFHLAPAFL